MIKKLLIFGLLSFGTAQLNSVVAVGDTPGAPTTFQFSVGSGIYDAASERLWTLSGQDTSSFTQQVQSYGISYTPFISVDNQSQQKLTAFPYLPAESILTIAINGNIALPETSVVNPLFGQSFDTVTFLGTYLTTVATATPQLIYLIQSTTFSDGKLGTTSPDGYSIMNVLDLGAGNQAKQIAGSLQGVLFIASAQGTFGSDSSQISFASTFTQSVPISGQATTCTGMVLQAQEPITSATPVLTAQSTDLAAIGSLVTLYPSPIQALQMYVGLNVTAAVDGHAVGLFTAQANQAADPNPASVTFHSIISDAVATSGLQTPISTTATNSVAVGDVTTTITSTGLSYIINSRYDQTGQQYVYAMPMVTMSNIAREQGMVADFNSVVSNFKITGTTYRIQGFGSILADDQASQIDIASSQEAVVKRLQVGVGPVPLVAGQFIEQLVAQGDAVYITIQQPLAVGTTPGMFKSQALFDPQGRIQSWTPWQRVAGTDDQMLFAIKNRISDATMYVSGASSNTIQQTTWNNSGDLAALIAQTQSSLPGNNGGIQNIIPFSPTTPGFTVSPDTKISMLVTTGNNAVVIAQTGKQIDGSLQIIEQTQESSIVLDNEFGLNIGSVVSADVATDSAGGYWFFFAGDGGVAVLSQLDGLGFDSLPNDGAVQALIADGQTCKTIGNFNFVKKIAADESYLYVMTQDAVYRFFVSPNKFRAINPDSLEPQLVVSSNSLSPNALCTDMILNRGVVILGTTAGLYRINALDQTPDTPIEIAIPGGLSAVSRLQLVSDYKFSFLPDGYRIGNLYVLTIDYSLQQTRLNRFAVENEVVTPIQDQLLEDQNGPLLIFDYMSNNIFIDGSLGFATSYRIRSIAPAIKYLQYTLQAGKSSTQILLKASTTNLPISALLSSLGVAALTRDYASGALVVGGQFGILADC